LSGDNALNEVKVRSGSVFSSGGLIVSLLAVVVEIDRPLRTVFFACNQAITCSLRLSGIPLILIADRPVFIPLHGVFGWSDEVSGLSII